MVRDVANVSGDQRAQFVERRDVHQQGDVAVDFFVLDIEFDMQKKHEG